MTQPMVLTVGAQDADYPGFTNAAVQAAIEALACRGGGTVILTPGNFQMQDSLHLRSHVDIVGSGDDTVLFKSPFVASETDYYLGYGHYDVTVKEPDKFDVGDGILIWDNEAGGFYATQTTVTWKRGRELGIAHMLNHDISSAKGGMAATLFPIIRGESVHDITIKNLKVDGNAENNGLINGCRGGGIFAIRTQNLTMENLTVTNVNGDGISFQQCKNVHLNGCRACRNTGHGGHPGSGTVNSLIENCDFSDNGVDGVFYCLRVTYSVFRNNTLCRNGHCGLSIGHRDFHIGVTGCVFEENSEAGIAYRNDNIPNASGCHTYIINCSFKNNCRSAGDSEIYIPLELTGLEIAGNTFDSPNIPLRCDKLLCDAYVYSNSGGPAPVTHGGIVFAPPENPYRVDLSAIPENAFAHLMFK